VAQGRFYLAGSLNDFFSDRSKFGTCSKDALLILFKFPEETLDWIQNTETYKYEIHIKKCLTVLH